MKVLYLDESGNHDLNPTKIAPNYPVFVLGGVIVDRAHVRNVIEPDIRQFKRTHFGREDVILGAQGADLSWQGQSTRGSPSPHPVGDPAPPYRTSM
ncbi:MAG: DUF3800 domain-containing protein [Chloroflexota bacterium]|nr:DUF3800 domain-containing protein [Chloroflexota bacterium]